MCFAFMMRTKALAKCQNIDFDNKIDGENVNIKIDLVFRVQIEYKRPHVGLKNYREALALFTEFSNLRMFVYTQWALIIKIYGMPTVYTQTVQIRKHFTDS